MQAAFRAQNPCLFHENGRHFRKERAYVFDFDPAIDDFCLGEEYKDYDMLQYILQELDDKPLLGIDFMKAGLKSPVNRNRYRTLLDLEEWVENKSMPLEELSPELFELVKDLKAREINEDNLDMINALIAGETEFSDDEETED